MSNLTQRINELVPKMDGWCSIEKANDLALAVLKLKASVVVEIGVYGGRSLLPMALACQAQDHGEVWAIDPWSPSASIEQQNEANANWWGKLDHEAIYQRFIAHVNAQGVSNYVRVVRQKSDDVTPPESICILHIDGNHSDQTIKDVERFASKVRIGGFCFMDDIHWEGGGVERAVDKLKAMGFKQLFARDTGAMFERVPLAKKGGWPKGKKRTKK